jgi:hypothetical protein
LWCSQSGDQLENDLAKFGYKLCMKIGKKKNRLKYILAYLLDKMKIEKK